MEMFRIEETKGEKKKEKGKCGQNLQSHDRRGEANSHFPGLLDINSRKMWLPPILWERHGMFGNMGDAFEQTA